MNTQTTCELVDLLNGMREQVTYWNNRGDAYRTALAPAHTYAEAYSAAAAYAGAVMRLERILVADADRREAAGESAEEARQCEKCGASE